MTLVGGPETAVYRLIYVSPDVHTCDLKGQRAPRSSEHALGPVTAIERHHGSQGLLHLSILVGTGAHLEMPGILSLHISPVSLHHSPTLASARNMWQANKDRI